MSETEWLVSDNPARMLQFYCIGGMEGLQSWAVADQNLPRIEVNERGLRYFCAAAFWHRFGHEVDGDAWGMDWRNGVQGASTLQPVDEARGWIERHNTRGCENLLPAFAGLLRDTLGNPFRHVKVAHRQPCWSCMGTGQVVMREYDGLRRAGHRKEWLLHCHTCNATGHLGKRDLWLTPLVQSLAQDAHDTVVERPIGKCTVCRDHGSRRCHRCKGTGHDHAGFLDNARLMILADAMEDGGASELLTDHLRMPGPHVRGCWVVDAVLHNPHLEKTR
jgi:hypothetical protein